MQAIFQRYIYSLITVANRLLSTYRGIIPSLINTNYQFLRLLLPYIQQIKICHQQKIYEQRDKYVHVNGHGPDVVRAGLVAAARQP